MGLEARRNYLNLRQVDFAVGTVRIRAISSQFSNLLFQAGPVSYHTYWHFPSWTRLCFIHASAFTSTDLTAWWSAPAQSYSCLCPCANFWYIRPGESQMIAKMGWLLSVQQLPQAWSPAFAKDRASFAAPPNSSVHDWPPDLTDARIASFASSFRSPPSYSEQLEFALMLADSQGTRQAARCNSNNCILCYPVLEWDVLPQNHSAGCCYIFLFHRGGCLIIDFRYCSLPTDQCGCSWSDGRT